MCVCERVREKNRDSYRLLVVVDVSQGHASQLLINWRRLHVSDRERQREGERDKKR